MQKPRKSGQSNQNLKKIMKSWITPQGLPKFSPNLVRNQEKFSNTMEKFQKHKQNWGERRKSCKNLGKPEKGSKLKQNLKKVWNPGEILANTCGKKSGKTGNLEKPWKTPKKVQTHEIRESLVGKSREVVKRQKPKKNRTMKLGRKTRESYR